VAVKFPDPAPAAPVTPTPTPTPPPDERKKPWLAWVGVTALAIEYLVWILPQGVKDGFGESLINGLFIAVGAPAGAAAIDVLLGWVLYALSRYDTFQEINKKIGIVTTALALGIGLVWGGGAWLKSKSAKPIPENALQAATAWSVANSSTGLLTSAGLMVPLVEAQQAPPSEKMEDLTVRVKKEVPKETKEAPKEVVRNEAGKGTDKEQESSDSTAQTSGPSAPFNWSSFLAGWLNSWPTLIVLGLLALGAVLALAVWKGRAGSGLALAKTGAALLLAGLATFTGYLAYGEMESRRPSPVEAAALAPTLVGMASGPDATFSASAVAVDRLPPPWWKTIPISGYFAVVVGVIFAAIMRYSPGTRSWVWFIAKWGLAIFVILLVLGNWNTVWETGQRMLKTSSVAELELDASKGALTAAHKPFVTAILALIVLIIAFTGASRSRSGWVRLPLGFIAFGSFLVAALGLLLAVPDTAKILQPGVTWLEEEAREKKEEVAQKADSPSVVVEPQDAASVIGLSVGQDRPLAMATVTAGAIKSPPTVSASRHQGTPPLTAPGTTLPETSTARPSLPSRGTGSVPDGSEGFIPRSVTMERNEALKHGTPRELTNIWGEFARRRELEAKTPLTTKWYSLTRRFRNDEDANQSLNGLMAVVEKELALLPTSKRGKANPDKVKELTVTATKHLSEAADAKGRSAIRASVKLLLADLEAIELLPEE